MEMTPVLVASNTVLAMWPCAMRILCDMASLLIRVLLRSAYRFQKCHFLMCHLTSSITKLMFSNRFRNLCSLISTISSMNSMITPAFFAALPLPIKISTSAMIKVFTGARTVTRKTHLYKPPVGETRKASGRFEVCWIFIEFHEIINWRDNIHHKIHDVLRAVLSFFLIFPSLFASAQSSSCYLLLLVQDSMAPLLSGCHSPKGKCFSWHWQNPSSSTSLGGIKSSEKKTGGNVQCCIPRYCNYILYASVHCRILHNNA